ncbi:hypothetical protein [Gemella sp. zg-1178]|nr:hypothetical protein [Gemella sp. zg-1178]
MFPSLDNNNALNIENYLLEYENLTLTSITHKIMAESLRKY